MLDGGYADHANYTNEFDPSSWSLFVSKSDDSSFDALLGNATIYLLIVAVLIIAVLLIASSKKRRR